MPQGAENPQTNSEEKVAGLNLCIQRIKETDSNLMRLLANPFALNQPIVYRLLSGTDRILMQAKAELNLPDRRIPRSPFKRIITPDSIRAANNCLDAIDNVLAQVRSILESPNSMKPKDFVPERIPED